MKQETKQNIEAYGLTIRIPHITDKTDVPATVEHVREVLEHVISASGDHIIVTGEIEIEHIDQSPLDPEPVPAGKDKSEYRFPPFGE